MKLESAVSVLLPDGGGEVTDPTGSAESVIVARSPTDIDRAAAALLHDGILCLVGSPWGRIRLAARARRHGMAVKLAMAAVPSITRPHYLVSLAPGPLRAARRMIPTSTVRSVVMRLLLAIRAIWFLQSAHSGIVLLARKQGASPLLHWLSSQPEGRELIKLATIGAGTAGTGKVIVIQAFTESGTTPSLIAKVATTEEARLRLEAEERALRGVAPPATEQVRVPRLIRTVSLGNRSALLEESLSGRPAAAVIHRHPYLVRDVVSRIASWLEAWHIATMRQILAGPALDRLLLSSARKVAPALSNGRMYLEWIESRTDAVRRLTLPVVHAHNDLTMWNVLVDGTGLGILDWETAASEALPLTDLIYSACDAVAATERYRDRVAAYEECFEPGGRQQEFFLALQRRLSEAAHLSPAQIELAHHATWLRHASNELSRGARGEFVAIAQRKADEVARGA